MSLPDTFDPFRKCASSKRPEDNANSNLLLYRREITYRVNFEHTFILDGLQSLGTEESSSKAMQLHYKTVAEYMQEELKGIVRLIVLIKACDSVFIVTAATISQVNRWTFRYTRCSNTEPLILK